MSQGRVVVASDHGGYALKEALKSQLIARGIDIMDVGTHSTDSVDYPVYARAAAETVARGDAWRGIVIDGAGIGSAMVANKIPGVRCGMAFNAATARNAREHNDANVLTLGAGYLDVTAALEIVTIFLSTDCTVDRHQRRVAMIDALDTKGGPPAMTSASNHEALVDRIAQVLTRNPAILAPIAAAGAPASNICTTCNPQKPRGELKDGLQDACCTVCVTSAPERVRQILGGGEGFRVTSRLGIDTDTISVASVIDHTLLKANATYADIDALCDEAIKCGFASVCVNPFYVRRAAQRLRGQKPLVCTVVGFPLGATPSENKALETRRAIRDGAREIDMVINIGALKSGDHQTVYEDIRRVAEAAHEGRAILKVIIETLWKEPTKKH